MNTAITVVIIVCGQFGYWGGKEHNDMNIGRSGWVGLDGGDGRSYTFSSNGGSPGSYEQHVRNRNRVYALAQTRATEKRQQNQQYIKKDTNINYNYSGGYGPVERATAERIRIENRRLYIETRWELQNQNQERLGSQNSYLDRLERRIDALERAKDLNERYRQLTGKNP